MPEQRLHHLTEHVYWLSPKESTDRPIIAAIAGKQRTFVVEAGNSAAHVELFLQQLAKHEIAAPTFAAVTHWHWDHVFGIAALNVPTFAHHETQYIVSQMTKLDWSDAALDQRVEEGEEIEFCRDMLKAEIPGPDRSDLQLRTPDIAFSDFVEIDLGGVHCQLIHVGGDHSPDSIVAYVPEEKVMFLGDCIYPDLYHGPSKYTRRKLFPLLDHLLSYEAEYYLDAHNPELTSRDEMADYAEHLQTIGEAVDSLDADREAVLSELPKTFGESLSDDDLEDVDAFLAGYR